MELRGTDCKNDAEIQGCAITHIKPWASRGYSADGQLMYSVLDTMVGNGSEGNGNGKFPLKPHTQYALEELEETFKSPVFKMVREIQKVENDPEIAQSAMEELVEIFRAAAAEEEKLLKTLQTLQGAEKQAMRHQIREFRDTVGSTAVQTALARARAPKAETE